MKKAIIYSLVIILCFSLFACSPSNDTPDQTQEETETLKISYYGIALESNKQPLPTYDELKQIERGMTLEEVTALVGNPQREFRDIFLPQPSPLLFATSQSTSYRILLMDTPFLSILLPIMVTLSFLLFSKGT